MVRWMVVLNMRTLGDSCDAVVLVVVAGVEGYEAKTTGVVVAVDTVVVALVVVVVINVVAVEVLWERVGDESCVDGERGFQRQRLQHGHWRCG